MAHYDQNWDDLGRSIRDTIERAVNSRDFQQLNERIRQTVDQAASHKEKAYVLHRSTGQNRKLYCSTVWKNIQSFFCILSGVPFSFFGFFGVLAAATQPVVNPAGTGIASIAFLAVGAWLLLRGRGLRSMTRRYRLYREALGANTHCSIKELASVANKSEEFVRRDLLRLTERGFFRQGHLNKEQTHFLTSHESFRYYEKSRLELEQRQKETVQPQNPELQTILARGEAYLAQVRKCNDDIPGEEISEKISRIEMLTQRIFDRVTEHPEVIPDLKKLMEYYLPMTVKLLSAYADMDMQPVQGDTITASKREIEDTLDTVNYAFEKLLDDLFADTAMDVSSDITVLNTLLAQEGLLDDGLHGEI